MARRDAALVAFGVLLGALLVWPLAWGEGFETGEELAESLHGLEEAKARAEELRAEELRELYGFALARGYVVEEAVPVPSWRSRVTARSCAVGGAP